MKNSLNHNMPGDASLFKLSEGKICRPLPVDLKFLLSYLEVMHSQGTGKLSLLEYAKSQNDFGPKAVIVPDLHNLTIAGSDERNLLNISQADFRGCLLHNSKFYNCDLSHCNFQGIALNNVIFRKSILNHCDFRGCDLETAKFDSSYTNAPWNQHEQIKFSFNSSCLRVYADIKNEIARSNEKQRLLDNKRLELLEMRGKIDFFDRVQQFFLPTAKNNKYLKLKEEIKIMETGVFSLHNIIHHSIANIFNNENNKFDPLYHHDRQKTRKYIQIGKKVLLEYLNLPSKGKKTSLNEYTKQKYITSIPAKEQAKKYVENFDIVTDISSKVNMFGNNEWTRLDLRKIHFKGCNLSRINFTGSDLTDAKFENCDITECNFESAELSGVVFVGCKAKEAQFKNISAMRVKMQKSDFSGSNFIHAKLDGVFILDCNLNHIHAKHIKIKKASIEKANFSNSNLYQGQIVDCAIKGTRFIRCNLEKAILTNNKIEDAIFDSSRLLQANFSSSSFIRCNMLGALAIEMKMSETRISDKSNFTATNFSSANFDGAQAPQSNFNDCIFDRSHMGYAKFNESNMERVSMKLAQLDNCAFNKANLQNADFSGAQMFNTSFVGSKCNNSNFQLAKLSSANFIKTNISDCDWQNFTLKNSLLEGTYNHRVRVNDNTNLSGSVLRELDGQFYHYDGDNFMTMMFIEQQQVRQKKVVAILSSLEQSMVSRIVNIFSNKDIGISADEKKELLRSVKAHQVVAGKYKREIERQAEDAPKGQIFRAEIFDKINELEFRL